MITVVSGLPRSGTSLMMQMLAAGGMPVLTDVIRVADEDNPWGYFEFEPVKRMRNGAEWLANAEGKAVKVIYALLRDLPPGYEYRVILMLRDLSQVLASQQKMLQRLGQPGAGLPDDRMAAIFASELNAAIAWVRRQPGFSLLEVNYQDCAQSAGRINAFLGGGLDEKKMAQAVLPPRSNR